MNDNNTFALPDVTAGGAKMNVPIYSAIADASKELGNGHFNFGDATSVLNAGMDILTTVLDPLGAIIGAALDCLKSLILEHVKPLNEALNMLAGDPDGIYSSSQRWIDWGNIVVNLGNNYVDMIANVDSWKCPQANLYRSTARGVRDFFQMLAKSLGSVAGFTQMVGAVVAIVREILWILLKEVLTEVIKNALLTLAASIPTLGTAIAAFTAWFTAKMAIVFSKFSKKLSELVRKVSDLLRKLGKSGRAMDGAGDTLSSVTDKLADQLAKLGKRLENIGYKGLDDVGGQRPKFPGMVSPEAGARLPLDNANSHVDDVNRYVQIGNTTVTNAEHGEASAEQARNQVGDVKQMP